jgi:hypothetical protein
MDNLLAISQQRLQHAEQNRILVSRLLFKPTQQKERVIAYNAEQGLIASSNNKVYTSLSKQLNYGQVMTTDNNTAFYG